MGRRIILSSRKRGKHSHFAGVTVAPAPARPHAGLAATGHYPSIDATVETP